MNANQMMNMAMRMFFRKAMNMGINKGVDMMAGKPKNSAAGGAEDQPMTKAERRQRRQQRQQMRQAKQAMKASRRVSKF